MLLSTVFRALTRFFFFHCCRYLVFGYDSSVFRRGTKSQDVEAAGCRSESIHICRYFLCCHVNFRLPAVGGHGARWRRPFSISTFDDIPHPSREKNKNIIEENWSFFAIELKINWPIEKNSENEVTWSWSCGFLFGNGKSPRWHRWRHQKTSTMRTSRWRVAYPAWRQIAVHFTAALTRRRQLLVHVARSSQWAKRFEWWTGDRCHCRELVQELELSMKSELSTSDTEVWNGLQLFHGTQLRSKISTISTCCSWAVSRIPDNLLTQGEFELSSLTFDREVLFAQLLGFRLPFLFSFLYLYYCIYSWIVRWIVLPTHSSCIYAPHAWIMRALKMLEGALGGGWSNQIPAVRNRTSTCI